MDTAITANAVVVDRDWVSHRLLRLLGWGAAAGVLLVMFPWIDLHVSQAFYAPGQGFPAARMHSVGFARVAFMVFYVGCVVGAVAFAVTAWRGKNACLGLNQSQWLFVLICLGIGPGFVANTLVKDQWGRARPKHAVEFGGGKAFTPALAVSNQCRRNCSFVSGEASSVFMPFYALAVVLPQASGTLVIAGTIAGLAAGMIRVVQGAHFLSDVVFASLFMAATALMLRTLLFRPIARPTAPGTWWGRP